MMKALEAETTATQRLTYITTRVGYKKAGMLGNMPAGNYVYDYFNLLFGCYLLLRLISLYKRIALIISVTNIQ